MNVTTVDVHYGSLDCWSEIYTQHAITEIATASNADKKINF